LGSFVPLGQTARQMIRYIIFCKGEADKCGLPSQFASIIAIVVKSSVQNEHSLFFEAMPLVPLWTASSRLAADDNLSRIVVTFSLPYCNYVIHIDYKLLLLIDVLFSRNNSSV